MSFADSVGADYRMMDGLEPVTFTSKAAAGDTVIAVEDADGRELSAREIAASNGYFQQGDKIWYLGGNQIPAAHRPGPGDTIADAAGTVWYIVEATLDPLGITWQCVTRRGRT
jgi:hypothetical protein